MDQQEKLEEILQKFKQSGKLLTVLTGAGVSAESGIPTFRGTDGYWTAGSKNYKAEEMGTYSMFRKYPLDSWKWYLYRNTVCRNSEPNNGHKAIVQLEKIFGDRFRLITQNIDGLHARAGNSHERTYCIHGTFSFSRCGGNCTNEFYPFPSISKGKEDDLTALEIEKLKCPKCGDFIRPHVLWFDEFYDELNYRAESSIKAASETGLLLIVGTSGSTNLPYQIVRMALNSGAKVIDINPFENAFGELAHNFGGVSLRGNSGELLPKIVKIFESIG